MTAVPSGQILALSGSPVRISLASAMAVAYSLNYDC